ncbi:LacI family DNA-binding transcriptional regulator [Streptomyces sp. NPDC004286]|uniref:LacI family DNA-binding transcriptional regulator n=1 Tax=Streptomyces sp. NPDC004286 TaxID=3364696 RepID=UPI003683F78F
MGYAEKRSGYWRGRYKIQDGKYGTVADSTGAVVKFATKREAKQAADAEEVTVRRGQWRDPSLGQETFGEYASRWYAGQDLAASTMQNYRRHIEEHLLPDFEDKALAGILRTDVEAWEKKERASYAASSVKTWRSTLHLIFEDAIDEGLLTSNPAARRRGRGKRAGRSRHRGHTGELVRCPPKDDSYRTIDSMDWLSALVFNHIARTKPTPCACHGRTYVFRGQGAARTGGHQGAKLVDVARRAGVSTGTVSNVLNRPDCVHEDTRVRVELAVAELGFVRGGTASEQAAHWRRNGFATWLFTPAVSGWYPKKAPQEARPVPILGEPWPGVPARGCGAAARADACWLPIAKGLTPHGLRHTHRTMMEDLGTEKVLMDERMGHIDGSVSARYAHVTPGMRRRMLLGLTEQWEAALDARLSMSHQSPVAVLDALLQ